MEQIAKSRKISVPATLVAIVVAALVVYGLLVWIASREASFGIEELGQVGDSFGAFGSTIAALTLGLAFLTNREQASDLREQRRQNTEQLRILEATAKAQHDATAVQLRHLEVLHESARLQKATALALQRQFIRAEANNIQANLAEYRGAFDRVSKGIFTLSQYGVKRLDEKPDGSAVISEFETRPILNSLQVFGGVEPVFSDPEVEKRAAEVVRIQQEMGTICMSMGLYLRQAGRFEKEKYLDAVRTAGTLGIEWANELELFDQAHRRWFRQEMGMPSLAAKFSED